MHFSPENGMIPSESASQELSNEWLGFDNLDLLGNFCVPPLVTEFTISP
jgi:hypothetical protein